MSFVSSRSSFAAFRYASSACSLFLGTKGGDSLGFGFEGAGMTVYLRGVIAEFDLLGRPQRRQNTTWIGRPSNETGLAEATRWPSFDRSGVWCRSAS
jgi:hypothetical protein